MDCSSKFMYNQKVYNPNYSCAKTKSEAVAKNVFAPWAMENLHRSRK